MSEKIVSPGVFTYEKDLTYLAQGISAIGATIVGPTEKGPAFVPITIGSQNEFMTKFGTSNYYTNYAVQEYLKSAGTVTVIRVLGMSSWNRRFVAVETNTVGAYPNTILAVLGASGSDSTLSTFTMLSSSVDEAHFLVNGIAYTASFNSARQNYITKVFSGQSTVPVEVILNFSTQQSRSIASASTDGLLPIIAQWSNSVVATFAGDGEGYGNAKTPWVISQNMGPNSTTTVYYNLFRFHTRAHGKNANTDVKVGIFDVTADDEVPSSDYGKFSVVVRRYSDTDSRPEVLESFANATLDPTSINYLPRLIGDKYPEYKTVSGETRLVYTGDWNNKSSYVRVEMAGDAFPKSAVPMGFSGYTVPIITALITASTYPTMSYARSQLISGETSTRAYRGVNFDSEDSRQYFTNLGLQTGQPSSTGSNQAFHLDTYIDFTSSAAIRATFPTRKFMFGFQGGADGMDPRTANAQGTSISATNTQGYDCSKSVATGSLGYKRALDIVANPDEVDINLIVLPGIIHEYHSYVTKYAINICEERGDCFYIMDLCGIDTTIASAITTANTLDTNYVGVYYPWVKILDPSTSKPFWLPPSAVMCGVFSFNDKVAQEWFAPAGLNRGGISSATDVYTKLNQTDRDSLYNNRINPIAYFPGQGVVAWGQKTLQAKASALDRINVRRLLIAVKKYIASSTRYLVFEQNVTATRNRFINIVNPYLESVQNRAGLYAFKVIMDETNNTPDIIDKNQLYGQIYLQPTKTAEFILIDFNILPTGATFPE